MRQLRSVALLALALAASAVHAADIAVNALFNGKAMLVVDGGKPRIVSVGQSTPEGVKLISASSEAAVIEYKGQKQSLSLGQGTRIAVAAQPSRSGRVVLTAERGGHFFADGWINGNGVRFLVDTGATTIALSTSEARRLGLNYQAGRRGMARTASGTVMTYGVKLATVRIGDITLHNVDAAVVEGAGPSHALLGMSFLNRTQMNRDGERLTLIRRY
jgi:aspartyl protease family protein